MGLLFGAVRENREEKWRRRKTGLLGTKIHSYANYLEMFSLKVFFVINQT